MTKPKKIKAWWFAKRDAYGKVRLPHGDGREVVVGETLSVEGKIVACKNGLHASVRAMDALKYAPGSVVCRVEVWGDVAKESDKVAGRHRKVLWMADADAALRHFACDCAEAALLGERKAGREPDPRSWAAIEVARRFADGEATKEELAAASAAGDAAASAAGDAAWDAASAARDAVAAADAAAWAAARADRDAAAAWDAQNKALEARLNKFARVDEGEDLK